MSDAQSEWVSAFVAALRELRPEIGRTMAYAIALYEWPQQRGIPGDLAGRQWAARPAKPK